MESFLDALNSLDIERILSLLADDVEYQNVPLPPDRGKKQVERTLRASDQVKPICAHRGSMTPESQKLAQCMGEISQRAFCAGWMDGLEYSLWRIANAGGGRYGLIGIDGEGARELLLMAAAAGGWILFDDNAEEETFVALAEWLRMYANSSCLKVASSTT